MRLRGIGAADVQQLDAAAARAAAPPRRRPRHRPPAAAGVGAVRHDRQPIASGMPASATSAWRVASLSHATCAARCSPSRIRRDIQRNGTERRSSVRLEDRAEGVEVVARHERPLGRQRVHEVRVTVIDDVVHVEPADHAGQRPRVVPLPRDDAIDHRDRFRRGDGIRPSRRGIAGRISVGDDRVRDARDADARAASPPRDPCSPTPLRA